MRYTKAQITKVDYVNGRVFIGIECGNVILTARQFAQQADQLVWIADHTGLRVDHPVVEQADGILADLAGIK